MSAPQHCQQPSPAATKLRNLVVWPVLGVVALIVIIVVATRDSSPPPPPAAPVADAGPPRVPVPKAAAHIGQTVTSGNFAFTITSVSHAKKVGDEYLSQTAQGRYTILRIAVKNVGHSAKTFTAASMTVLDTVGNQYNADPAADSYLGESGQTGWSRQIRPGNSVSGAVAFDLPADASPAVLQFTGEMFSSANIALR